MKWNISDISGALLLIFRIIFKDKREKKREREREKDRERERAGDWRQTTL